MICDNTYEQRWWPAIAAADSNFIAVWGQGYGSACNVWGNVDVTVTGVTEDTQHTLCDFGLNLSVHPNPFHHLTEIRYSILDTRFPIEEGKRKPDLKILDAAGRLVRSFNLESCIVDHVSSIRWDGTDQADRQLGSGVYFLKLQAGDRDATKKLLLVR
jgi:hypothetical protein